MEGDEPKPTSKPKGRRALLVADSDPWIQDPVAGFLRQAGYEVLAASDGLDTVAVLEEHAEEIVAVLMDSNIPGDSGNEIFEDIRRIRPNIPIIMMSGFSDQDVMGRFLGMGVVGFLKKPFGPLTLFQVVQKVLDHPAA
jgi:two-component system cell cycle sensor histidine kinase/response regulator CckA